MIPANLLAAYRQSPPQEGSLQHLCLREMYPPDRFRAFLHGPSSEEPPDLQGIYPLILPQTERIERIRDQFFKELRDAAVFLEDYEQAENPDSVQRETAKQLRERFCTNQASFFDDVLLALYNQGFCPLSEFVFSCYGSIDIQEFAKKWFAKVSDDFRKGDPRSFSTMSKWLANRQISEGISFNSLDETSLDLETIGKLAYLGVERAIGHVVDICEWGHLGEGDKRVDFNYTPEKKETILWKLVKQGSSRAYKALWSFYIFKAPPPKDKRKQVYQSLIEHEVGLSFEVVHYYQEDPYDLLLLNDRLKLVYERARLGNINAMHSFWYFYTTNKWKERCELSEEERWEKLKSVETPENQAEVKRVKTCWALNSNYSTALPCRWSPREKLEFLDKTHPFVWKAYQTNRFQDQPLGFSLEERIEKMIECARSGSKEAMECLMGYFLNDRAPTFLDSEQGGLDTAELRMSRGAPGFRFAEYDYPARRRFLFDVALEGGMHTLNAFLRPEWPRQHKFSAAFKLLSLIH